MKDPSLTEHLAAWLVRFQPAGHSQELLSTAADFVLDWLGSALAGQATPVGRMLMEYAGRQPAGSCLVLGTNRALAAEAAALVNGALSHIVEMDDLDRGSVLHPGAVIIPAALAVAQRQRRSHRDFLLAVVAGYEIAIRIGQAVGKQHYYYFHNTATCGVFGAAAAAGWLLKLNAQQMVWALGNAGTQAAGLWQFNLEGDMSKHLHAGRAAANGVLAADLATLGFTGARHVLDGLRGFFSAMAPGAQPARVVQDLDPEYRSFKISGVSIKPHASCRHTHPAIDAALALREVTGDVADRVTLDTYQAALDLCNNPDPQTPYAAKFSLHYCIASALIRGHVGLADFAPDALQEPPVRALMARITARVNKGYEAAYPNRWPARLRLHTQDGRSYSHEVTDPRGDPENPLTRSELEVKFRRLAEYGQVSPSADHWLAWIRSLESDPDQPVLPT